LASHSPSPSPRPRARRDLTFGAEAGQLALRDRAGATARRLSLLDALVWTYCDGRHDVRAIARHVSAALPEAGDHSAVQAAVASLLAQLAREGMLA
jgi:hypothetical protein